MLGGRIGFMELTVILVIALVIFGPAKIPEIGRAVGKGLREFKKETNNLMGDGDKTKTNKTAANEGDKDNATGEPGLDERKDFKEKEEIKDKE